MSASRNRNMTAAMQARFLELLPSIREVASYAFRRLSGGHREELMAEVVAHAFAAFARLVELGKAEVAFGTVLGHFAVRRVHSGRFVGRQSRTCDVLSKYAQRSRGFVRHARISCSARNRLGSRHTSAIRADRNHAETVDRADLVRATEPVCDQSACRSGPRFRHGYSSDNTPVFAMVE